MDTKIILTQGINKYNYLTDRITFKEYNELLLKLPSVKIASSANIELINIENKYKQHIDNNLLNDEYLKLLSDEYNKIIMMSNE